MKEAIITASANIQNERPKFFTLNFPSLNKTFLMYIKNATKNFYDFKVEDFEIEGYDYNKDIKLGKIPVAI